MKLKVKETFRDINSYSIMHEAGSIIDINDEHRAANLVNLGLAEVVEQNNVIETEDSNEEPKRKTRKTVK